MGWQDLIQQDERVAAPWLGGATLRLGVRSWTIDRPLPREYGWYKFKITGRRAKLQGTADNGVDFSCVGNLVRGYVVGDRVVSDDARIDPDPDKIVEQSEQLCLIEPGLGRFARVQAARAWENGPLIYRAPEMPLGPEGEVLDAYLNRVASVTAIKNVCPALDAAFRLETQQRAQVERRRAELEIERLKEANRRRAEGLIGTGAGRRELAATDFAQAATAALRISGAEYLDHTASSSRGEMEVRYRIGDRKFECVCDATTLRIVDAGICLRANGEIGDTKFTLESLPVVVMDADRRGVLHIFRHVDRDRSEDDDYYDD